MLAIVTPKHKDVAGPQSPLRTGIKISFLRRFGNVIKANRLQTLEPGSTFASYIKVVDDHLFLFLSHEKIAEPIQLTEFLGEANTIEPPPRQYRLTRDCSITKVTAFFGLIFPSNERVPIAIAAEFTGDFLAGFSCDVCTHAVVADVPRTIALMEENGMMVRIAAETDGPFRDYYFEDKAYMKEMACVPGAYSIRDGVYHERLTVFEATMPG